MNESSTWLSKWALPNVRWAILVGLLVSGVICLVAGIKTLSVWVGVTTFPIVAAIIEALLLLVYLIRRPVTTEKWLHENQAKITLVLFVGLCTGVLGIGLSFVSGQNDRIYPDILHITRQSEIQKSNWSGKAQQEATRGPCSVKVVTGTVLGLECIDQGKPIYTMVSLDDITTLPVTHELGKEVGRVLMSVGGYEDTVKENSGTTEQGLFKELRKGALTCQQTEGYEKPDHTSYTCFLGSVSDLKRDLRVALLEAGLAVVGPGVKADSEMGKAEKRAKEARRGLWWDPPDPNNDPIAWRIARDETRPNADLSSAQRAAAFGQFVSAMCTALIGFGFLFATVEQSLRRKNRREKIERKICRAEGNVRDGIADVIRKFRNYQPSSTKEFSLRTQEILTEARNLRRNYDVLIREEREALGKDEMLLPEESELFDVSRQKIDDLFNGFVEEDLEKACKMPNFEDFKARTESLFESYNQQIKSLKHLEADK